MNYFEEQRADQKSSISIIIPILWFMRASSKGISFWLNVDVGGEDYLEGSAYDRMFFTLLMASGVIILLLRKINWASLVKSNIAVLLFFSYMGISIFWSDFTSIAVRRWVHTLGDLIMILVIITELNPAKSLSLMFRIVSLLLLFISIILIKYYRHLGVAYNYSGDVEMWTGVATHKNTLGQLALMGGLYCLWNFTKSKSAIFSKMLDGFIFFMAVFLLNGSPNSNSITAILTFIIGIIILTLFHFFRKIPQKIVTIMLLFVLAFGFYSYVSQFSKEPGGILSVVAGSVGKDPTLTGRTDLWNALIEIGSKHFPLGVGYGSFWIGNLGNDLWETFIWKPEQGHNGYIDVYVELGIVGLILLILVVWKAINGIRQDLNYYFSYGTVRFTLLMVSLTHNITESSFGRASHLMWLLFLLAAVNVSDYRHESVICKK